MSVYAYAYVCVCAHVTNDALAPISETPTSRPTEKRHTQEKEEEAIIRGGVRCS